MEVSTCVFGEAPIGKHLSTSPLFLSHVSGWVLHISRSFPSIYGLKGPWRPRTNASYPAIPHCGAPFAIVRVPFLWTHSPGAIAVDTPSVSVPRHPPAVDALSESRSGTPKSCPRLLWTVHCVPLSIDNVSSTDQVLLLTITVSGIVLHRCTCMRSIADDSCEYDCYHNVGGTLLVDLEYPFLTLSRSYSEWLDRSSRIIFFLASYLGLVRACHIERLFRADMNPEARWRAHCLHSWIRACNWRQTFLHRHSPCFWFKLFGLVKTWVTSITGPHRSEILSPQRVDALSSRRRRELSWGRNLSICSTRGGKHFSLSLLSWKKRCLKVSRIRYFIIGDHVPFQNCVQDAWHRLWVV